MNESEPREPVVTSDLLLPIEATGPTRLVLRQALNEFFEASEPDLRAGEYEDSFEGFVRWLQDQATGRNNALLDHFNLHEASFNAALSRILAGEFANVFGFDRDTRPFPELTEAVFKPGRTSVISTNHLRTQRPSEQLIVQSLLAHIVEAKLGDSDAWIQQTPIILVIDEAHRYLSDPSTARDDFIVEQTQRIAREGRSSKLGLFIISQNPDIDETIRSQINTKIVLGHDTDTAREIGVPKPYLNRVEEFNAGQALVKGADGSWTEIRGFSRCLTCHEDT